MLTDKLVQGQSSLYRKQYASCNDIFKGRGRSIETTNGRCQ